MSNITTIRPREAVPIVNFSYPLMTDPVTYDGSNTFPNTFYTPANTPLPFTPNVLMPPGVTVVEYYWTFGDGGSSYAPSPLHTFARSGTTPQVTLRVLDSKGRYTYANKTLYLTPPVVVTASAALSANSGLTATPPYFEIIGAASLSATGTVVASGTVTTPPAAITSLAALSSQSVTLSKDTTGYVYNPDGTAWAGTWYFGSPGTILPLNIIPAPSQVWQVTADVPDETSHSYTGGQLRLHALASGAASFQNDYFVGGYYPGWDAPLLTVDPAVGAQHIVQNFVLGSFVTSRTSPGPDWFAPATRSSAPHGPYGAAIGLFYTGGSVPLGPYAASVDLHAFVGGVQLTWDAVTAPSFSHYNVYRSVNGGAYGSSLYTGTTNQFTDTTVTSWGLPHAYKVTWVDTSSNESPAATVNVTPDQPPA